MSLKGGAALRRRGILLACLLGIAASRATAGSAPPTPPGSELTVSILTMGIGPAVWERFGHNAIVIEDRRLGTSVAYNYGMFSFRQQNFILRFLRGRMLYWMADYPTEADLPRYAAADRAVWRQELRLDPAARLALRDFLEWNAEPEHAYYRYDYYRDNCSTRVRDAIDRVTGGALRAQSGLPGAGTYRFHTLRLNTNNPLLYTGLDVVLGHAVDVPVSRWDEMFLPLLLHDYLRDIRVPDSAGQLVPLVVREDTLVSRDRYTAPAAPPGWSPWFFLVGVVVGGSCWWGGANGHDRKGARRTLAIVGGAWTLVTGVTGLILAGLWGFTDHVVAARNENVLQCTVFALALAAILPLALRHPARWSRAARLFGLIIAGASAAGLLLKLLPAFGQANLQILALTLPANLGLAAGLSAWAARARA